MTRPAHAVGGKKCAHHRYGLGCEELDRLRAATSEKCQLCGQAEADTPHEQLHIDHDHEVGDWAVRGLLCSRCNTMLGSHPGVLDHAAVAQYLAAPWYMTGLELTSPRPAEPPVGSHLQLPNGAVIHRISGGWVWRMGPRPVAICTTWAGLWYRYGPRGLRQIAAPSLGTASDDTESSDEQIRSFMAEWEIRRDAACRRRDDTLLFAIEQGWSQKDIIRLTKYSRGTVRTAVARARAHLAAGASE